jgi:branched-chain amino acid transport system permease protein
MFVQVLLNGLSVGALYALAALAVATIAECCGFFDLSQGAVYVVGFYVALVGRQVSGSLAAGAALGMLAGAILGGLLYSSLYEPLQRVTRGNVPVLIASLAVLRGAENVVSLISGPETKSLRTAGVEHVFQVGSGYITTTQFYTALAAVIIFGAVATARETSSWGRLVRAIASDRELAVVRGIRVKFVAVVTVVIGSAVMALAGVFGGLNSDMNPRAGFGAVLIAWVATVLGGSGRITATVCAGLVIGLLQNIPMLWVASQWQDALLYTAVLIVLLFRPRGLGGAVGAQLKYT